MKNIIFIGSGAVASEVISYLKEMKSKNTSFDYSVIGYLDDSIENFKSNAEKYNFLEPYLGKIDDHIFSKENNYIFGLGKPEIKSKILSKIYSPELSFPNFIHDSVYIPDSTIIGIGNIIYPYSIIGPNVTIGDFNLLTSYSFVSHDCKIGNNNFFSTTGLSGNVVIKDNNFFGIRATIIPDVKIGSENTIQAGMVIDKNIGDYETVFYRFKEKISVINQSK